MVIKELETIFMKENPGTTFSQLNSEQYLVPWTNADDFRKDYSAIFHEKEYIEIYEKLYEKHYHKKPDQPPKYYTPHCWKHTGAVLILLSCRRKGLSMINAKRIAKDFFGHSYIGRGETLDNYVKGYTDFGPMLDEIEESAQVLDLNAILAEQLLIKLRTDSKNKTNNKSQSEEYEEEMLEMLIPIMERDQRSLEVEWPKEDVPSCDHKGG